MTWTMSTTSRRMLSRRGLKKKKSNEDYPVFEVFGHYQQHPLLKESKDKRDFIPGQNNQSQRFNCLQTSSPSSAHVHAKFDLMVWFEVCELTPNGEYIPVVVDHHDDTPCRGTFLLHQGIQRRIRITVVHEHDADVNWKEIRELVVSRVRTQPECPDNFDDDLDESALSLSLFPGEYLERMDDRVVYRFEAAWDSSLHNSILLNRVTPTGKRIYLTLSSYLDLENCTQPAIITKDLCLIIYGRDARTFPRLTPNTKALKHLLSGAYKNADCNHISAVYELILKRAIDFGSPGVQRRQRRVLDTSATYVRGEENLHGWQPRGDSLKFDHQWELEKMKRLELVERIRHMLMVRDKLTADKPEPDIICCMSTSASRMNLAALTSPTTPVSGPIDDAIYSPWDMSEKDRELCSKCVQLIQTHIPSKPGPPTLKKHSLQTPTNEEVDLPSSVSSSPELLSPDKAINPTNWLHRSSIGSNSDTEAGGCNLMDPSIKPLYVPEIEEICVSPVISRKGMLNLFDEKTKKWGKRWLVVKRPYLFLFCDDKDPIERGVVNLANAQVEYSEEMQTSSRATSRLFSIATKHRGYLLQTCSDKEVHDWLYAINPLLAGEIRSKISRGRGSKSHDLFNEVPKVNVPVQCNI